MTGMLASVVSLDEARIVRDAGVDIVDLKNPAAGALGALPADRVEIIVTDLAGAVPISATVGDLPMDPELVGPAVAAMAATGVDYVKIGFFPGGDWMGVMNHLTGLTAAGTRLVAVLFADQRPDLAAVASLARAGFAGVMLDTREKSRGSLATICPTSFLGAFVGTARTHGLLCGLAGSLREEDIPELLTLNPDYLGFRGALCHRHSRTAGLDANRARTIRSRIASAAPSPQAF